MAETVYNISLRTAGSLEKGAEFDSSKHVIKDTQANERYFVLMHNGEALLSTSLVTILCGGASWFRQAGRFGRTRVFRFETISESAMQRCACGNRNEREEKVEARNLAILEWIENLENPTVEPTKSPRSEKVNEARARLAEMLAQR